MNERKSRGLEIRPLRKTRVYRRFFEIRRGFIYSVESVNNAGAEKPAGPT